MSENGKAAKRTYAEIARRKAELRAFSPEYAPAGVHIGYSTETGKVVLLNSSLSEIRGLPQYDSAEVAKPVLVRMNEIMIADNINIWKAAPRARNEIEWEAEAKQRGISVDQYLAQKEQEREAEQAQREQAKALREKTKALEEHGLKVKHGRKNGMTLQLSGEMMKQFMSYVAEGNGGKPLADFIASVDSPPESEPGKSKAKAK